MLKLFMFCTLLLSIQESYSQVGIGTTVPDESSILDISSTNKGVLYPRLTEAERDGIVNPAKGLTVYNLDEDCLQINSGTPSNVNWSCIGEDISSSSSSSPLVVNNCDINGFEGVYVNGTALTASNTFSLTITNNSFNSAAISFTTGDLVLSGVSGLTVSGVSLTSATVVPGGSQIVEYSLTGTPSSTGTLTGVWTKLGLNCTRTIHVTNGDAVFTLPHNENFTSTNNGGSPYTVVSQGTITDGDQFTIPYTGGVGNFTAYTVTLQDVAQESTVGGTRDLTLSYSAGSLSSTGNLTLTLGVSDGGTTFSIPTVSGAGSSIDFATFPLELNGNSKGNIILRAVDPIPSSILLNEKAYHFIASVYDTDYLPYTDPTAVATTIPQAADGITDAITVDLQGSLSTAGITLTIPVNATGSNTLPAFSQTINIPANLTEDGIARDVEFSWPATAYTSSTNSINVTLKALGGTLNAKKLDLQTGTGNDALGVLMGTFTYPYNTNGDHYDLELRDIAGIPDREFGDGTHDFLYVPVVGEDGEIWLNNNLGAHYSDLNHASFNSVQQATSSHDHLAYGSLYQWGRYSDGHELINYTSSTGSDGTEQNRETSTNSNNTTVGHDDFILETNSPHNWYTGTNPDNLWQGEGGTNNPCPQGFRLPTGAELDALGITDVPTAWSSILKLSQSGYRYRSFGELLNQTSHGYYWSSTVNGTDTRYLLFFINGAQIHTRSRARGFTVRCIKD